MIVRSKRTQKFTVIPNCVLDDKSLDWNALGLLVYLLSKPDDWAVSVKQLVKVRKAGESAIRTMLKALRDAGYVVMEKKKTGEVDWHVFDTPQAKPDGENPKQGKSQTGKKPNSEKAKQGKSPYLLNTDKTLPKTEKTNQRLTFDSFWSAYPRKEAKEAAERAWRKLTDKETQEAFTGINRFTEGKEKQFIAHPATYLNGKRWNDMPIAANDPVPLVDEWDGPRI